MDKFDVLKGRVDGLEGRIKPLEHLENRLDNHIVDVNLQMEGIWKRVDKLEALTTLLERRTEVLREAAKQSVDVFIDFVDLSEGIVTKQAAAMLAVMELVCAIGKVPVPEKIKQLIQQVGVKEKGNGDAT